MVVANKICLRIYITGMDGRIIKICMFCTAAVFLVFHHVNNAPKY